MAPAKKAMSPATVPAPRVKVPSTQAPIPDSEPDAAPTLAPSAAQSSLQQDEQESNEEIKDLLQMLLWQMEQMFMMQQQMVQQS